MAMSTVDIAMRRGVDTIAIFNVEGLALCSVHYIFLRISFLYHYCYTLTL